MLQFVNPNGFRRNQYCPKDGPTRSFRNREVQENSGPLQGQNLRETPVRFPTEVDWNHGSGYLYSGAWRDHN